MRSFKQIVSKIVIVVLIFLFFSFSFNKFYIENISKENLEQYIFFINLRFTILVMIVFVLAAFLLRIIGTDFKFLLKGYDLLNKKEYDENALPKLTPIFKEEKRIAESVTRVLQEQSFLQEVKSIASHGYIMDDVLDDLFFSIQKVLKTDRVGIAFVDYHKRKIVAEHGVSNQGPILLGPGFEVPFEATSLTELIESKNPLIINDLAAMLVEKPNSPSLKLMIAEGMQSNIIYPLLINDSVFAFLFFSSIHKDNYTEYMLQTGQNIVTEIGMLLDKTYLTKMIFSKITNTFADLVDQKDNETGGHITRMVQYSTRLAKELMNHPDPDYQVNSRFVSEIENNASVHDIGKVGIPDVILKKPGKLTPEEWVIMRTHTTIGGNIFASLKDSLKFFNKDFYLLSENIARYHHEKWDGTGYPIGLSGKDIPLEARIVAVADVLDALTSKRVYKDPLSFEDSLQIIKKSSGSHLDPVLVEVLLKKIAIFEQIYKKNNCLQS